MIKYIDLSRSSKIKLPYLGNEAFKDAFDGKGWSFSYVYHFSELKDVYLAIRKFGYLGKREFAEKCIRIHLPYHDTPWDMDGRRLLEHVNALKNFGLINPEYEEYDSFLFESANIGDPINNEDKMVFKSIFFSYYRFKEIMSWFIDPLASNRSQIIQNVNEDTLRNTSHAMFSFGRQGRFVDSFILELVSNTPIYFIANETIESNGGITRFWDVFVKWAQELDLIEKFNLKNLDYELSDDFKALSCIYFKKDLDSSFDLMEFIKSNYQSHYISIPKLIFKIAKEFRYSIKSIKGAVTKGAKLHSDQISLQRTSEIFIRNTEINFIPIVDNSYVSHILIQ